MFCPKQTGVTVVEIFDETGKLVGKRAQCKIEPVFTRLDYVIGLSIALAVFHWLYMI